MTVHAPYAFVPLSKWIYRPDWRDRVSHDVPFEDGVSGSFEIKFLAVTPLLVGGPRKAPDKSRSRAGVVWPYQDDDNKILIPGSSLQGMARSILEISAFGRMRLVDADRRFGLRDLSRSARPIYQNRLTPSDHGVAAPKVRAGWLRRGSNGFELYPCEWAKIEVFNRPAIVRPGGGNNIPQSIENLIPPTDFAPEGWRGKRDLLVELPDGTISTRYDLFPAGFVLNRTFEVDDSPQDYNHSKPGRSLFIRYRRAWTNPIPGQTTPQSGRIVLTGVPGDNKHMEFFFYFPGGATPTPVATDLDEPFRLFRELHEPTDGRKENPNWRYYRDVGHPSPPVGGPAPFSRGGAMPVFYLEEDSGPAAVIVGIGLASMFKLPHRATVRQLMANTDIGHAAAPPGEPDNSEHDFATLLFGAEADRKGLKRRVSFDLARSDRPVTLKDLGQQLLNTPKPSYYPSYVRQPRANIHDKAMEEITHKGRDYSRPYASYTPFKAVEVAPPQLHVREHERPEISGFKVYPAERTKVLRPLENFQPEQRAATVDPRDPDFQLPGAHMKNSLCAAPANTLFSTVVRFHNLRKIELGALLWTLTYGDENAVRGKPPRWTHRLGLGKPLGMGEIKILIAPKSAKLAWTNSANNRTGEAALVDAMSCFVRHMNEQFAGAPAQGGATWSTSEQIRTLLAAADPNTGSSANPPYRLAYMSAKQHTKAKDGPYYFLSRYLPADDAGPLEDDAFPRS